MMKKTFFGLLLVGVSINQVSANTIIQGYAYANKPIDASVIIRDANNKVLQTTTNNDGFYRQDVSNLTPPLIVFTNKNSLERKAHGDQFCNGNCLFSYVYTLQQDKTNTVNINPLTDYLTSELAKQVNLIGPEKFVDNPLPNLMKDDLLKKTYNKFHLLFDKALLQIGIEDNSFDPITTNSPKIKDLLDVMLFNRGYHSATGQISENVLLDMRFRPISQDSPFDYQQAVKQQKENMNAKKRIFILGDSTASNYDKKVYPRMGWGQVFDQFINDKADTIVINGAQSGRSSRSFKTEGWFHLMKPFMKKGDYMIIAFGHNDEKCDGNNPKRGQVDVANLCTYPNDDNNQKQYPLKQDSMSFQSSLEDYLAVAKELDMTPILMTPVTRFKDKNNKTAYQNQSNDPVSHMHYTANKPGFAYWGDYSNTIKHTAKVNQVTLIDLESLSIDFANQHKDDWQSYWLVIDPNDPKYPYYKNQTSGVISNPDTTHFQEKGAQAIAKIIATAINNDPKLKQDEVVDLNKINQ